MAVLNLRYGEDEILAKVCKPIENINDDIKKLAQDIQDRCDLLKNYIEDIEKYSYNVVIDYIESEEETLKLKQYVEDTYKVKALAIRCDVSNEIEVKNMNLRTNKVLSEAGILFAITTDHPVTMLQYLPICAGIAVKHGLSVEDGLKAITINAARICRVDDRVGSLKKGKDADIAIFTGNPMEVFTKTLYTIINGQVVYSVQNQPQKHLTVTNE